MATLVGTAFGFGLGVGDLPRLLFFWALSRPLALSEVQLASQARLGFPKSAQDHLVHLPVFGLLVTRYEDEHRDNSYLSYMIPLQTNYMV